MNQFTLEDKGILPELFLGSNFKEEGIDTKKKKGKERKLLYWGKEGKTKVLPKNKGVCEGVGGWVR